LIDIHCHILPGLDDGPRTLATSLAMAERAAADGIQTIIATPHTDGIRVGRKNVAAAVEELNLALQRASIPLAVYPGYEIPFHLAEVLAGIHTLADGGRFVLIELPPLHVPLGVQDTFLGLIAQGLIPILAHPERNEAVVQNPELLRPLVDNGTLIQITAMSITGGMGVDVRRCVQYLVKKGMAHFLATDSHSPTFREPVLSPAVRAVAKLVGPSRASELVEDTPRQILARDPEPPSAFS
jgi:protein-tyrosine phosphatase